jgi:ubiquitin-protein ligase
MCHVDVDEKGEPCVDILDEEHWTPTAKLADIFRELLRVLATPAISHAKNIELAWEFHSNPAAYEKRVRQHVQTHAK